MTPAQWILLLIAASCFVLTVMVASLFWSSVRWRPAKPGETPGQCAPELEEPFNVTVWVPPSEWDVFEAIMAGMPDVEDTYNTILQETTNG